MSVIGKKPFVNYIIDECSVEQTNQIVSLMNNLGESTFVALYGEDYLISNSNKGVSYVTFALEQLSAKIIKGILVYIDNTHCGFFGISPNSDIIEEFRIDPVKLTAEKIREYLTIEELRQVCGDRIASECSGSAAANVYRFSEGDELTEEIWTNLKDGDIIIANNCPFVIRKDTEEEEEPSEAPSNSKSGGPEHDPSTNVIYKVKGTYCAIDEEKEIQTWFYLYWNSGDNGSLYVYEDRYTSNIHYFNDGDELTAEIYNTLKSGDIISLNQRNFVITKNSFGTYPTVYYVKGYSVGIQSPKGAGDIPVIQALSWSSDDLNGLTVDNINISGGGSGEETKFYKHHIYLNVVEFEDGAQIHDYISENGTISHEIIVINNDPEFRDFSLVDGREGIDGYAKLCEYILSSFNAYFVDYASLPNLPPQTAQIVVSPSNGLKIWDIGLLVLDDNNNTGGHGFRFSGYGEVEVQDINGNTVYVEVLGQGDAFFPMVGDSFKYFILSKEDIENDTDYPEDYPFVEELSYEDFDTFKVSLDDDNNGGGGDLS